MRTLRRPRTWVLLAIAVAVLAVVSLVTWRTAPARTTLDPFYSADPANPSVVLVLGSSLSNELTPALERAVGDNITVVNGTDLLSTEQSNWQVQIEAFQPDVIVVSAGSTELSCMVNDCIDFESRHRAFMDLFFDAVSVYGSKVIWFGAPALGGPAPAYITSLDGPSERFRWMNAYDKERVEAYGGVYVDTIEIVGRDAVAQGPDGDYYQARKSDSFHLCPVLTTRLAAAIATDITTPTPALASWWKGDWWRYSPANFIVPLTGAYECNIEPVPAPVAP